MSHILDLSKHTPIATGGRRVLYEVPEYPNMIIKVNKPENKSSRVKLRKQLLDKLLPSRLDRHIKLELDIYNSLNFNRSQAVLEFLPKCFGVIQTSEGLGLIFEKISEPDGRLAPTLRAIFLDNNFTQEHLDKLNQIIKVLFNERVVVNGIHAMNFVYVNNRCFIVDGLGDRKTFIPLRSMFKTINRHEYRKKMIRLANGLDLKWNSKTDQFEWNNNT